MCEYNTCITKAHDSTEGRPSFTLITSPHLNYVVKAAPVQLHDPQGFNPGIFIGPWFQSNQLKFRLLYLQLVHLFDGAYMSTLLDAVTQAKHEPETIEL